ncbi:MAG: extracellular solute-binding protein, partial [Gemmatimonadales bacterium]
MERILVGRRQFYATLLGLVLVAGCGEDSSTERGPLTVFNAGSLARPFKDLLDAFVAAHPDVTVAQENAGSLETARKLTELNRIPDVVALADYRIFPELLMPEHVEGYELFATNSMVLVYSDRSIGADEITPENWWEIVQRPGVRAGHSNPALDPNGYRTLMVFQLAEQYYGEPGLEDRLKAAFPERYMRPKEADLTALIQAGELDYAFSYASIAHSTGLGSVDLPAEIDLSNPSLAEFYALATVQVPGATPDDTLEFRGEPIMYALAIPKAAPHPDLAREFVQFVLSAEGQGILENAGMG